MLYMKFPVKWSSDRGELWRPKANKVKKINTSQAEDNTVVSFKPTSIAIS